MRSSLVGIVLAACAGCGPKSQLDPKASVIVSGVVQTQNGAGAASTTVKLIRHPDALQALGEVFEAVGSIGLACLAGRLDICSAFEESPSGSDGSYQFALRGADAQGSTGEALTFTAFASCAAQPAPAMGNCAVASDFLIQRTRLTIPALREWTDLGSLSDDAAGDPSFSWPALEQGIGGGAADDYRVSIYTGDGTLLWLADANQAATATVDKHVTQDLEGSWGVEAQRKQPGSNVGTDFADHWYSSQQAYPSHRLTPLSRASDCFTEGVSGPVMLARPCPLTDGNPSTRFQPVAAPACPMGQMCQTPPVNNWIMVDLGFSHPLSLLVLYDVAVSGASSKLLVETSDDMTTWALQATLPPTPYQTAPLAATARFVRVRLSDPNAQFSGGGNGEIAIYAPF